jgi:phosphoglycerate dehydrogenase-like enzyme
VRRGDSLAELIGQCDFVSVHPPLTAETRGLIGAEAFAAKRGMILINTARGSVVDMDAPCDAMKHGMPHSASYTPGSMRDNRAFAARAACFLRDGRLENCVNKRLLVPKA